MKNLNVLVLHDHPFSRMVIVTALRTMVDGRIYEASEGATAITLLKACGGIDVAICKLHHEGQDGLAFLREASRLSLIHSVIASGVPETALRDSTAAAIECLNLEYLGDLGVALQPARLASLMAKFRRGNQRHAPGHYALASQEDVRQGLKNGEFKAYYQPIVDIDGKILLAAEVLARWHHRSHGLLSPAHFLATIVSSGLIDDLFQTMFEQGLAMQADLRRQGVSTMLAFNLHPIQLTSSALSERIGKMLARYQAPAQDIMLEITEDAMVSTPAHILDNFLKLRDMGCGLSMDDFGAGHASLDRLCALPFNQIKLDATFTRSLKTQPRAATIIRSVVEMSKALHVPLVVEGVETLAQQTRLRELGCTVAQGYLYARPMPTDHFVEFCRTHVGDTTPQGAASTALPSARRYP